MLQYPGNLFKILRSQVAYNPGTGRVNGELGLEKLGQGHLWLTPSTLVYSRTQLYYYRKLACYTNIAFTKPSKTCVSEVNSVNKTGFQHYLTLYLGWNLARVYQWQLAQPGS